MSEIRAVLFDLDGTILDSAPDLIAALNAVRKSESLSELGVPETSHLVSRGAIGLIKAGMPATDQATFESWRQILLKHYAENSFKNSSLYSGISELIEYLVNSNIPWGVVTNKSEALTLPIIEAAKLNDSISCLVCGDTLSTSKPDPAPVTHACNLIGVAPENTLFIGDDINDLEAGRAAGTQIAAVHYGYGSFDLNDDLVAGSFQIHHPIELLELVQHR